jgi:hypothetical protein
MKKSTIAVTAAEAEAIRFALAHAYWMHKMPVLGGIDIDDLARRMTWAEQDAREADRREQELAAVDQRRYEEHAYQGGMEPADDPDGKIL